MTDLALVDDSNEINGALSTQTPDSEELAPDKVHIRGVDDLTTNDLRAFSIKHFPEHPISRVEWIDDTSANLVYDTPLTASNALSSFTFRPTELSSSLNSLDLRPAKPFASLPESHLQVRIALATDRKRPHAYESSRFYLMHPEHDPREQGRDKTRNNSRKGKGYRKRRYSDGEDRRRRRRDAANGLDASMYDDDGSLVSSLTARSKREMDSYRPTRDRSASPDRQRKHTPPPSYRSRDPNLFPEQNKDKELFPRKNKDIEGKDLFSNKLLASKIKKDLFSHKTNAINHRRSDAFDAADETVDLFASRMSVPFTDGASSEKSLGDRVTKPSATSNRQRNVDAADGVAFMSNDTGDYGLNIRGASQGFSIRGGASNSHVGTIRELFPGKANAGKELFSEKLKGRGGPRTKAEDLFY